MYIISLLFLLQVIPKIYCVDKTIKLFVIIKILNFSSFANERFWLIEYRHNRGKETMVRRSRRLGHMQPATHPIFIHTILAFVALIKW